MKILYINSVYGKGSTGNIVRTLHLNNLNNGLDYYSTAFSRILLNSQIKRKDSSIKRTFQAQAKAQVMK